MSFSSTEHKFYFEERGKSKSPQLVHSNFHSIFPSIKVNVNQQLFVNHVLQNIFFWVQHKKYI